MAQDMRALRDYVTAMDGRQYESVPEGVVCLLITHSNLKLQMVDIRLDLHGTIGELRHKVYQHTGTKPDAMELLVMRSDGSVYARLDDDRRMLGFYSVENGMRLHVVDKDPFSLSRGGGLETSRSSRSTRSPRRTTTSVGCGGIAAMLWIRGD